jgi:hypothetical protein
MGNLAIRTHSDIEIARIADAIVRYQKWQKRQIEAKENAKYRRKKAYGHSQSDIAGH